MRLGSASYLRPFCRFWWLVMVLATTVARASSDATAIPIEPEAAVVRQVFRFDAGAVTPRPQSVHLAGTFNHWSHTDTFMTDVGGGVYSVTLQLAPGLYHYKFLVDDDRWFGDPSADKTLEDAEDHHNCGVIV